MNAVTQLATPRALRYAHTSFRAFKVSQGSHRGKETPLGGRTYDLGVIAADTLDEALNEALARGGVAHKEHLVIQESGERGIRLHLFAIRKKSAPRWVMKDHVQRAVYDLYASPMCTVDGGILL